VQLRGITSTFQVPWTVVGLKQKCQHAAAAAAAVRLQLNYISLLRRGNHMFHDAAPVSS
jgi:hypothetical protein